MAIGAKQTFYYEEPYVYRRKSIGPRKEPWRTTLLTKCSYTDSPPRHSQCCLLPKNDKIRPNTQPKIT